MADDEWHIGAGSRGARHQFHWRPMLDCVRVKLVAVAEARRKERAAVMSGTCDERLSVAESVGRPATRKSAACGGACAAIMLRCL